MKKLPKEMCNMAQQQDLSDFANIDLKTFVDYLLSCDPQLTQVAIAKKIGVTPVTLSKVINARENAIRPSWLPALVDLLQKVNNLDAYQRWTQMQQSLRRYNWRQKRLQTIRIISDYLNSNMPGSVLRPEFYEQTDVSPDYFCFDFYNEKCVYFFTDPPINHMNTFVRYPGDPSLTHIEYAAFVSTDERFYQDLASGKCFQEYNFSAAEWIEKCDVISTILLSLKENAVKSDVALFNRLLNINYLQIQSAITNGF